MASQSFFSKKRDRVKPVPLDKIVLGIGASYLGLVLLWRVSPSLLLKPGAPPATSGAVTSGAVTSGAGAVLSARDREFIAYLQQSLKTLDQNRASRSQPNLPNPKAFAPYPSYPGANPSGATHPSPLATQLIPGEIRASSRSPRSVVPPQPPLPSEPLTRLLIPPPLPVNQNPVLSPPPRTNPVPPPPPSPLSPPAQTSRSKSPAPTAHNLVGLLEAGDQSTVLVTFEGITRRFAIGESLGNSGWRLVSVNNQKATLSRQGITRSLEVGQDF
jgi:hypothetical protein